MTKKPRKESRKATRKERIKGKKQLNFDDSGDLNQQLRVLGLHTKEITGDGNYQYFGHDNEHRIIRQEVCDYLEENGETYQFFVEDDIAFEDYLESMRQNGTYGGNMVLVAFAKLYEVDIKIYQPGLIYVIEAQDNQKSERVMHIAYHDWEHYSSIRNIDGPFKGMPEIKVISTEKEENEIIGEELYDSKEKMVLNACPEASIRRIRRLLRKYKGDPDKVIDDLYESENPTLDEDPVLKDSTESSSQNALTDREKEPIAVERSIKPETAEGDLSVEKEKNRIQAETVETCSQQTKDPKQMSAGDRKKEAKRKQKAARLAKIQAKASAKVNRDTNSIEHATESMKEMYI